MDLLIKRVEWGEGPVWHLLSYSLRCKAGEVRSTIWIGLTLDHQGLGL